MMGLWGKENTYTKLLQRISEKNAEGLELHRQSLQNGQMYHWIHVPRLAEEHREAEDRLAPFAAMAEGSGIQLQGFRLK